MYFWFLFRSPSHLRRPLFDWSPFTAYRYIAQSVLENSRLARRRNRFYIRDVFRAWNGDWKASPAPSRVRASPPLGGGYGLDVRHEAEAVVSAHG
jgi:hypothetical protein